METVVGILAAASRFRLVDADRRGVPAAFNSSTSSPSRGVSFVSTRVASTTVSLPETSFIAGSVLPIQRAEELLSTLPGVISARIVASGSGAVEEIHILTTDEVSPKQTVRNVESALIAHLGMRVSHKKISVATSSEGRAIPGSQTPPKGVEGLIPMRGEKPAPVPTSTEPSKATAQPAPGMSNLSPSPLASGASHGQP